VDEWNPPHRLAEIAGLCEMTLPGKRARDTYARERASVSFVLLVARPCMAIP
jgi:hypothetical protein